MEKYACYLVTCLDDREDGEKRSQRILASRRVFETMAAARQYAKGVAKSRRAQVLPCIYEFTINRQG